MSKRLERVQSIHIKIESTDGTDSVPATANAVRVTGGIGIEEGAEVSQGLDATITELLSKLGPLAPSAKWVELTIPVFLKGFGAAYSASNLPEVDVLLRICSMSQTVVTTGGSETVTYEMRSTAQETGSIYWYADGMRHNIVGARGTVAFLAPAGDAMLATFTVRGIYVLPTDVSLVAGTYQSTTVPPLFKGASSLSYNSVATLITRRFEAQLNATVAARINANATDALAGFMVTAFDPQATFACEAPLAATVNFRSDRDAATARVLDITVGSTQYNRIKLHYDKFTPRTVKRDYDNGMQIDTVTGRISNEGTEDFAIIFD